jgi:hypothetical protein
MDDFQTVKQIYRDLKSERDKYTSLWKDISKYVGISVDIDYQYNGTNKDVSKQADDYVDDPTAAIAVNQFGDYLLGIMWGTGAKALSIVPSRYVLERTSTEAVQEYYDFVTDQTLYHMNHSDAGLNSALKPWSYDLAAFGNAGIGVFKNTQFVNRVADNALIFRNFGVDSTCIGEGRNGLIDYVFCTYHWKIARIVGEFCTDNGEVSEALLSKLTKDMRDAWKKRNMNKEFTIIFGFFPREDYDPKLKGKRGTRYKGVWFAEGNDSKTFFHTEDFAEKPIAWTRMIKIRGEDYGRGSGTMLLSTIRASNFILGTAIEAIEKLVNPSLGILNNALFGDSVLDTSPNGLSVFNSTLAGGQNPLFPIHEVGDISALIQYLIPYLNEKISTAFKIDSLLDFSSAKEMTATESMHKYAIRGKSLSGLLIQAKETFETAVKRSVSLLGSPDIAQLGVDGGLFPDIAKALKGRGKQERIIPQEVMDTIKDGRPWFEIRFNNELEKLTRTESIQNLVQLIQTIGAVAGMYPQIIEAADWYKLIEDANDNLDANSQILIGAKAFADKLAAAAQQQQSMMALEAGRAAGGIQKDTAQANKANMEAQNAK